MRPILNYAAPIWFTQVSSSHLDKLEVIQNKALRVATGCHQKAGASHLRAETGVLPLRAHLELCGQQFYASALQPLHPSHVIVTSLPTPAPSGLPSRPHTTAQACESEVTTPTPLPPPHLRGRAGRGRLPPGQTPPLGLDDRGDHPVPCAQQGANGSPSLQLTQPNNCYHGHSAAPSLSSAPAINCSRLQAYRHSVGWADDPTCPDCCSTDHTVAHLFSCPTHLTDLAPGDMRTASQQVAQFLAGLPPFSDLPPLQVDFDSFPS